MVRPYTLLHGEILAMSARRSLMNRVRNRHFIDVVDHIATDGRPDGLSFLPTPVVERLIPEALARLRSTCPLQFTPHVFVFRPGASIAPHVDGRKHLRQCAILVPLNPHDDRYAPTLFWRDGEIVDTLTFDDLPALVNLQTLHSVPASPHFRLNFQMAFSVPYLEARKCLENWSLLFEAEPCE